MTTSEAKTKIVNATKRDGETDVFVVEVFAKAMQVQEGRLFICQCGTVCVDGNAVSDQTTIFLAHKADQLLAGAIN